VYVIGPSEQFGLENHHSQIVRPLLCNYNILIKQIVCGVSHTHLLTQQGNVYSMGRNDDGVLGLGLNQSLTQSKPVLINGISKIE
jgi:alpha-tubulin suppressor-like RCC1 family protein